jgi:hypothetical protein
MYIVMESMSARDTMTAKPLKTLVKARAPARVKVSSICPKPNAKKPEEK